MAHFTKRHYEDIAKCLKNTGVSLLHFYAPGQWEPIFNLMRSKLAGMLERDNPKFDRNKFYKETDPRS